MRCAIVLALVASPLAACSATSDVATDAGARTDAITPIPIRDGGFNANCGEAAQLVYVLSDANDLYSFRPNLRRFTRIGALRCPTTLRPNSMAIDRDAVAWVNYFDPNPAPGAPGGQIYRVNTSDASCTAAAPINLPQGWTQLGMGFATSGAGSTDETLFVAGTRGGGGRNSPGLARIDPASPGLVPIGPFSGDLAGYNAELTGTGDGRLYGFFTTNPVQVAQVERSSGAILGTQALPRVEAPSDWAFSFWGGAFYLYTAPDARSAPGRTTSVTRYLPSDGSVDTAYMTDIGFRIVGAGVSTCAPIAAPP